MFYWDVHYLHEEGFYVTAWPSILTWKFSNFAVKFTSHKMSHFKVYDAIPVAFSALSVLCHHHLYLVPEPFHHPKRKHCTHEMATPPSLYLQPPTTTGLLSASVDLPALDISYTQSHTVSDRECLASFT